MLDKIESWQAECPILKLRKKMKLSRDSLAAAVWVSYRAVVVWETGLSRPNASNMRLLCHVLGPGLRAKYNRWMRERPSLGRVENA